MPALVVWRMAVMSDNSLPCSKEGEPETCSQQRAGWQSGVEAVSIMQQEALLQSFRCGGGLQQQQLLLTTGTADCGAAWWQCARASAVQHDSLDSLDRLQTDAGRAASCHKNETIRWRVGHVRMRRIQNSRKFACCCCCCCSLLKRKGSSSSVQRKRQCWFTEIGRLISKRRQYTF